MSVCFAKTPRTSAVAAFPQTFSGAKLQIFSDTAKFSESNFLHFTQIQNIQNARRIRRPVVVCRSEGVIFIDMRQRPHWRNIRIGRLFGQCRSRVYNTTAKRVRMI